jgi:hypothetical protein
MSKPVAAITNINHLQPLQGIHPAWLEAGYGMPTTTPPYYSWQTLLTTPSIGSNSAMPRQSLDALPTTTVADFNTPRAVSTTVPVVQPQTQVQQPTAATAVPSLLPQVPQNASSNGASADLNQLLNSTGNLTTDVVNQSAMLEQAQRQVEQQKLIQQQQNQQQMQMNQLQQQNAILAQQVAALKQQAANLTTPAVATPTTTTTTLPGGSTSTNPYLATVDNLALMPTAARSVTSTMPSLYSPSFSTAGMGLTPTTSTPPATNTRTWTSTTTEPTTSTPVSSTPASSTVTEPPSSAEETTKPSGKREVSNPDDKLTLTSVGIGKYQLDSEAAEAFKQANDIVKKETGKDIPLISAYRSPEHNKKIGGAPNSNHTRGGAVDLDKNASNYKKAIEILEANGFKSLRGVIYNKPGSGPQDEENHLDFVG